MVQKRLRIAVIFNSSQPALSESSDDRASTADLRQMIGDTARALRQLGHRVTVVPLANDLVSFQQALTRARPDVVFNQYEDCEPGALHEPRIAAFVRMLGFPLTGSPALALGLCRHKYMAAQLLQGAGVPIAPQTCLLQSAADVAGRTWRFPLIVHPDQEHAGAGLDRTSIVRSAKELKRKVAQVLSEYRQPALVQGFVPGREFNVGIVGGTKMRVLPLAEVDYSALPAGVPRIMSYAAKWIETSAEYKGTSVICPAKVTPALTRAIGDAALRAFRVVGGRGYGRVDIRLDAKGTPRVLEVNCNPCLDDGIGLARSAAKAGIAFPQLLQIILNVALEESPFDAAGPAFVRTAGARRGRPGPCPRRRWV
jgi:D-alanine-D-alanine ligase